MKRYVIERELPGIDKKNAAELRAAATASNEALAKLAPRIQWDHSYVVDGRTFCIYLAEDEDVIHEHSKLSGIPLKSITEVKRIIDPTAANG
jgi:hypothetical protein